MGGEGGGERESMEINKCGERAASFRSSYLDVLHAIMYFAGGEAKAIASSLKGLVAAFFTVQSQNGISSGGEGTYSHAK